MSAARINFEKFPVGSKITSYDKYGYYVIDACGIIEKHLGAGHAIIKTFEGDFISTVSLYNVVEIELL
jgi:hypothetical protein